MKDRVEYKRSNEIPGPVLSEARSSYFRFERHYHLDFRAAPTQTWLMRGTCRPSGSPSQAKADAELRCCRAALNDCPNRRRGGVSPAY
jgi:hypothetical protein